jgi:glucokinase
MLAPAAIVAAAHAGAETAAVEEVTCFARWLCRFAGDAALYFAARGGVYLGGGIPPRILSFLDRPEMRRAFEEKGRLSGLLAAMPLTVITATDAGLRGAAAFLLDDLARP